MFRFRDMLDAICHPILLSYFKMQLGLIGDVAVISNRKEYLLISLSL